MAKRMSHAVETTWTARARRPTAKKSSERKKKRSRLAPRRSARSPGLRPSTPFPTVGKVQGSKGLSACSRGPCARPGEQADELPPLDRGTGRHQGARGERAFRAELCSR